MTVSGGSYTTEEIASDLELLRSLTVMMDTMEAQTRDGIRVSAIEGGRVGNPQENGHRLAMLLFLRARSEHLQMLLNGFLSIGEDRTVFGQQMKAIEARINDVTKRVSRLTTSIREVTGSNQEKPT